MTFYAIALVLVVFFFMNEVITVLEASSLLFIYMVYCTFMKFNEQIEVLL